MSEPLAIRSLRTALVVEWLLIVSSAFAYVGAESSLPPELQTYLAAEQALRPVAEGIAFVALLGSLVASAGLWFLRAWARHVYVGTFLCLSVALAFGEPLVSTGLDAALSELSTVASGLVIGIIYFGGIRKFSAQQTVQPDRREDAAPG
jgi:predicted transporter